MEFTTAVRYQMDLTIVVLNKSELGEISKEQRTAMFDVWHTELRNPNLAEFAENCGGLGIRVESDDELESALRTRLVIAARRSWKS
jgi:thiamine pyrophosphate-dependent acetolactate synthase large subunit-like protein